MRTRGGAAGPPAIASAGFNAVTTAVQKTRRSSSSLPSDNHATAPGALPSLSHEATNAVFPEPAGAETSVNGWVAALSSASSSRGLRTLTGGGLGTTNFVAYNRTPFRVLGPLPLRPLHPE